MSSVFRKTAFIFAIGAAALTGLSAIGCSSGIVTTWTNEAKLRQQLIDKYHDPDVSIETSGAYLTITFVNSPLNQKDRMLRWQRARETAAFAVAHYPRIGINNYWVGFIEYERRLILFYFSKHLDGYIFDRDGNPANTTNNTYNPPDSEPPKPEEQGIASAKYNDRRNETDVSVSYIQLEGDLNNGIAMTPHFTVQGNVNDRSQNVRPPAMVSAEFASYANKPLFTGNAKLEIDGDQGPIYAGVAQLMQPEASGTVDSSTAQFLTAQIPYTKFVQVVNSGQVVIRLNNRRFGLSQDQIASLESMTGYFPSSR